MKQTLFLSITALLSLFAMPVLAETTEAESVEVEIETRDDKRPYERMLEKRGKLEDKVTKQKERLEEREGKIAEKKAKIEGKIEMRKEKKAERIEIRSDKQSAFMKARIDAAITRLETLLTRIDSRIVKIEATGKSMTEAKALSVELKADIAKIQAKAVFSSEATKEAIDANKALLKEIKADLIAANQKMMKILGGMGYAFGAKSEDSTTTNQ